MAPDLIGQALQFRIANDQPIGSNEEEVANLQMSLIREEYREFLDAHFESIVYPQYLPSQEECLKELADLVYVAFQYAAARGWELDEALARVHRSNMSKLVDGKPVKDDKGKVMKGPNYKPPFLEDLV